ncbi:LytTR family DNA-binding domain-containing protein [Weissella koreensis]|uniref:LytTR family DNA-binding domain-containing protein n=1 Tax=Weissella koreensis TaxID=165096 RepID=UPI0022BA3C86|nr:LytTR family DNA-binding domain-containing protein [Weissella koreensis]MCZ9310808.1 LytTR family DNA-binding domain-containing protein [Weissella koreensis]
MKIKFEQDDMLFTDELYVTVKAASLSSEAIELLNHLEQWKQPADVLPVTVEERVIMVPLTNLIAIEVYGSELTLYTTNGIYQQRGILKNMLERLGSTNFMQITKGSIINLDHLNSLEASFSGSMIASLTGDLKLNVSRKYLPLLRKKLGM